MDNETAVATLAALAHPSRLAIFRLLAQATPDGLAAGDIAGRVGVAATNASFHLKELDAAGLIEGRREGRTIRYAVMPARVRALLAYLVEDCCQGRPELCGAPESSQSTCCPREA